MHVSYKYHKKDKLKSSSNIYNDHQDKNLKEFYYKNDGVFWRSDDKNYSNIQNKKKYELQEREILKGKSNLESIIPPSNKEIPDIPHEMGYFETDTAGTVSVGFDRYSKDSNLGFTVMSKIDKEREGVIERDEDKSSTYFGGNYDGKMKPFKVGEVSFKYETELEEIKKVKKEDNDKIKDDKDNLLYQDEKENEEIKELKEAKKENPQMVSRLNEEQQEVEKIKALKRKKNDDFVKEIEEFIKKIKKGKVKMLVEADEVAKRKRRLIELSQNKIQVNELRIMLKRILGEEDVEDLLATLLVKTKLRGFDENDLLKIINGLKKEVLRK